MGLLLHRSKDTSQVGVPKYTAATAALLCLQWQRNQVHKVNSEKYIQYIYFIYYNKLLTILLHRNHKKQLFFANDQII